MNVAIICKTESDVDIACDFFELNNMQSKLRKDLFESHRNFFKDRLTTYFSNPEPLFDVWLILAGDSETSYHYHYTSKCDLNHYYIKTCITYTIPEDFVLTDELRIMIKLGHNPFVEVNEL